jgi:two-component sensor histidine kinase
MRDWIGAVSMRIISRYVGPLDRNTIEYWQRYIFYVITLTGIAGGTLCLVPTLIVLFSKSQGLPAAGLFCVYAVNILVILAPRMRLRSKTLVIAANFYVFGLASLVLAGPEGESGIWFSVSVLFCSLFIGFRSAAAFAVLNLLTGIGFGILHASGLIGWEILRDFPFRSWLLQSANIFCMTMVFAFANTMLIRGVGRTFQSLSEAEGRIRASLSEKETLIRELYHRSKNNMQVVSSMLLLHAGEPGSGASRAVFKDIINKIGAMSMVHQKLYESRDLSNINMAEYIRDLVALLMKSHAVAPDRVSVDLELEDVSMLIDSAIPCGLVVSEIVANSFKHAFPDGRRGRIRIGMRIAEGDTAELLISDDGIGMPEGFQLAKDGKMGMKTLFTMVNHQLQGSIQLETTAGVSYSIRFKRKLYDERVPHDA